jgi:hypothetical protein
MEDRMGRKLHAMSSCHPPTTQQIHNIALSSLIPGSTRERKPKGILSRKTKDKSRRLANGQTPAQTQLCSHSTSMNEPHSSSLHDNKTKVNEDRHSQNKERSWTLVW